MAETPPSFAQQMLTAIEAALLSRATGSQLDVIKTYTGDRGLERNPGELVKLRDQFRIEVSQETAAANLAAGGALAGRVRVRF